MINFTVGPVQMDEDVLKIGSEQIPYFRTEEFSKIMFQNEKLFLEFANAPEGSNAVFLTASSSGAMEAAVINCFSINDRVLIINGGSFGERFVNICKVHNIPFEELKLEYGHTLSKERLYEYDGKKLTGLLVNIHETSTGVLYDSEMIGEFCKNNNLLYVCDCVSSFLADHFDMKKCNADIMIVGSQKALACSPGISTLVLSPKAIERIERTEKKSFYFDIKDALKNAERGQTPFTPAVGTLLQINVRLGQIKKMGGVEAEIKRIHEKAEYFRNKIKDLPIDVLSESLSNALTPLYPKNKNAYNIFLELKDKYNIWVCPNGGELGQRLFRVGHIGNISLNDLDKLIEALNNMYKDGFL